MSQLESGGTLARDKLLEQIQNDLKNLSLESKKSKALQGLREATEEAIVKVRSLSKTTASGSAASDPSGLYLVTNQILYPLVHGCESKDLKVIKLSLGLMQRLIIHQTVDFKGARYITDTLWMLMEANMEELKILQTVTLLLTSSSVVQHETLAKCLVICFRLNFTKDGHLNTIAGATVRQLVPVVFERVTAPDQAHRHVQEQPSPQFLQLTAPLLPKHADAFVMDAYLLFHDIVLLVGAEQPIWMTGIMEMTRSFGLELLESILTKFPLVFTQHREFTLLLKEKVCSLVIKLFSPNIKYRGGSAHPGGGMSAQDKPFYPITSKLMRVVSILILEYHDILTTETEIFLSLVMKFLDPDKALWQNCIALEVIHKIMVKPELLHFLCATFDMNEHSTKVYQDMINGLGAFVQNVMSTPKNFEIDHSSQGGGSGNASGGSSGNANGLAGSNVYGSGGGISPQPGFFYRNTWKPLTLSFVGGQTKELYLDVSDKLEVPTVSDGYGISLAYACLLDAVRSMSLIIPTEIEGDQLRLDNPDRACWGQLIESSWCGVLAALSLLLDASTDDSGTENILKAMEVYSSICGRLNVNKPRDAYLASVCKASLPPHYTLNVLKSTPCTQNVSGPSKGQGESHGLDGGNAPGEGDIRHQVVAIGTPLPTSSLPTSAHQGPVMLTAKNLQCMRSILSVAHCHGNLLGQSWHIILTTLQHLVWILGLKPVAGGGLASSVHTSSGENNSVITTAVLADLPVLSNMVSRLFESSDALSETSISHLIEALCHLSEESMELATTNREPSLFAVAKLLETALVNLNRLDVVWRPITSHLLVVCQHPHLRMRQWGCEALTFLTKQSLQHKFSTSMKDNPRLQVQLLSPLAELCSIPFPDVRQKQLDTVLHILHSSGEVVSHGWPLILTIVGSIEQQHSDILIRSAFQCLQLIFADFLPTIPYRCYPQCVDCATTFGSQMTELNVSLTAVGLLWNLSDYFYQNVKMLRSLSVEGENKIFPDFPGCKNIPSLDKLWMCLFYKLKDLCLDSRPAVRKSSGQTLFSTIAAHGSVLDGNTWQAVLWQVLFPLLDNVIIQSDNASSEKVSQSHVIMIHHSRNTAQKQWAETKVLTISGVVRVFNTKRKLLRTMDDYSKAWLLLLEYVEKMALSDTMEVSLAALKAMQEMVVSSGEEQAQNATSESMSLREVNWNICWKTWLKIGPQKTKFITHSPASLSQGQVLIIGYIHIFQSLFPFVQSQFRVSDVEALGSVLLGCMQVPIEADIESPENLSPVHATAMDNLAKVEKLALSTNHDLIFEVFDVYFKVCHLAFHTHPEEDRFRDRLLLLGENTIERIADFFMAAAKIEDGSFPLDQVMFKIAQTLRTPLKLKYQCVKQSNWRVAINVLIKVLREGLPLARKRSQGRDFKAFWSELALVLEYFLFPESIQEQDQEDKMADEALDCHLIEILREEVLPHPGSIPTDFIRKIVILLNKGSIHSTIHLSEDCSGSIGLREDFAKQCFETLLDFSLLRTEDSQHPEDETLGSQEDLCGSSSITNRLAITSLLLRFKEVLVDAIDGEKLNRNIPLQRQKTAEIAFVLRAIATVISSMKKSPQAKVDKKTWQQVIALYPYLVQCTETNSPQIISSVKDALLQYQDLLQPMH